MKAYLLIVKEYYEDTEVMSVHRTFDGAKNAGIKKINEIFSYSIFDKCEFVRANVSPITFKTYEELDKAFKNQDKIDALFKEISQSIIENWDLDANCTKCVGYGTFVEIEEFEMEE